MAIFHHILYQSLCNINIGFKLMVSLTSSYNINTKTTFTSFKFGHLLVFSAITADMLHKILQNHLS